MIFEMCQEESLQSLSLAFGLPNLKDGSGGKYPQLEFWIELR